jgi:hypothetical protein
MELGSIDHWNGLGKANAVMKAISRGSSQRSSTPPRAMYY